MELMRKFTFLVSYLSCIWYLPRPECAAGLLASHSALTAPLLRQGPLGDAENKRPSPGANPRWAPGGITPATAARKASRRSGEAKGRTAGAGTRSKKAGGPQVTAHDYMLFLYKSLSGSERRGLNRSSSQPAAVRPNTVSSFVDRGE
eukprot:g18673.t1